MIIIWSIIRNIFRYPILSRNIKHELEVYQQFGIDLSEKTLVRLLENKFFEHIQGLKAQKGVLSKAEFILLVLNTLGKVNETDVTFVLKLFQYIDKKKLGYLDHQAFKDVRESMPYHTYHSIIYQITFIIPRNSIEQD